MTTNPPTEPRESVSHSGDVTKEFPKGKESYCPRCYFEDDKKILREDCPHNKPTQKGGL